MNGDFGNNRYSFVLRFEKATMSRCTWRGGLYSGVNVNNNMTRQYDRERNLSQGLSLEYVNTCMQVEAQLGASLLGHVDWAAVKVYGVFLAVCT